MLRVADPSKHYILQMDASDLGLGATLSQVDEHRDEHPVAFASRKLLPREHNYATVEKECLAIVWAVQFFRVYLYGQPCSVQSDHQPLSWLHRMKTLNPLSDCAALPFLGNALRGDSQWECRWAVTWCHSIGMIAVIVRGIPSSPSDYLKGGGMWRTLS